MERNVIFSTIAEIVKSATLWSMENEKDTSELSPAVTSHIISCLDLLSANYDGLAEAAAQHAAKFQLLKHLHAAFITDSFDERVRFISRSCCYTQDDGLFA